MMGSFTAFGAPALLKHKADAIAADVTPPLPQHPSPPPPSKRPKHDPEVLAQMRGLLQTGSRHLDTLWVAQAAAQEASGVMAAAMLRQQGAMREVSAWESKVEHVMRDMARGMEVGGSDL